MHIVNCSGDSNDNTDPSFFIPQFYENLTIIVLCRIRIHNHQLRYWDISNNNGTQTITVLFILIFIFFYMLV